jgi:hypothetical protein
MRCEQTDHEELAAYEAGELSENRRRELAAHLATCRVCQGRREAIRRADLALGRLRPSRTPPGALLATRRALRRELGRVPAPEVMTLDEVAEFLRLAPEQLAELLLELPAFELGGQLRVRRSRLVAWIETRERERARAAAATWVARRHGTGVA